MHDPLFFDNWFGLFRVLLVGTLAYVGLIVMLRCSGKRTLSKMNAFDLVVTVALGSTLATVLLSATVPLFEGLLALALLICLQFGITWASVRSQRSRDLIKSEPTLIVHKGQYLDQVMRRQRMTQEEVLAAVRQAGHLDIKNVQSVVLETDGSLSVVGKA
ncbi:DUF421 domain-containing protein [Paracoccus sp. JM45]|uniref:DUF421 domain-containing protein n=1 Tax=Paracoccus sp. JM45 TaxID=2283626 RepID=UPI000E6CD927|nr:YetF domain-containing protein [Paracoccus sp. JM45]RJE78802.1 DUF421 domain-containing protein [Paracoccus sp. JM45]